MICLGTPNLLRIRSQKAYISSAAMARCKGINSTHFESRSIGISYRVAGFISE